MVVREFSRYKLAVKNRRQPVQVRVVKRDYLPKTLQFKKQTVRVNRTVLENRHVICPLGKMVLKTNQPLRLRPCCDSEDVHLLIEV